MDTPGTAPSSHDRKRAGEGDAPPARILVVDDNDDCRLALCSFLEAWDFDVHEASGGEEAVELARELHPDLILMDIMMPGTDGLEATRRIRDDGGLDDVLIVAVSAMEGADSVSREAGCDACVAKPLDMGEFPGRVRRWLSGS